MDQDLQNLRHKQAVKSSEEKKIHPHHRFCDFENVVVYYLFTIAVLGVQAHFLPPTTRKGWGKLLLLLLHPTASCFLAFLLSIAFAVEISSMGLASRFSLQFQSPCEVLQAPLLFLPKVHATWYFLDLVLYSLRSARACRRRASTQ